MHTYDVAVVGAGPAGSAAAITLAQLGARTVLFDRAQFPRHKLCGDFLNPAAWPVLHKLGAADAVRACVHAHISSFSVTSAAGQLAASALPLRHDSEPALGIQRYYLDNVLIQRAGDLGVMVRQGCPVTTLQRDGGVWRVLMPLVALATLFLTSTAWLPGFALMPYVGQGAAPIGFYLGVAHHALGIGERIGPFVNLCLLAFVLAAAGMMMSARSRGGRA